MIYMTYTTLLNMLEIVRVTRCYILGQICQISHAIVIQKKLAMSDKVVEVKC